MSLAIDKRTLQKYNVSGPRYTSYPTAPVWSTDVNQQTYLQKLRTFGQSEKTASLYIHIPFCQSLCTFCACNVVIRRLDEKYSDEYLTYLFKEIEMVAQAIGPKKRIRQLHWGGGTPTYLSESQIQRLFKKIQQHFVLDNDIEVAIEIDPRTIDDNKITALRRLGFNRISMGVQDFSLEVQQDINRIQPFEMVKKYYDLCRDLEFDSVNFDLIYGLPNQTTSTFQETVKKVISLKPDRIALYSFAYVPWLKKQQNKIDVRKLPTEDEKIDIFLNARDLFLDNDYQAIAMDHFALKSDDLAKSFSSGSLYRNFMGYTVKPADEFIGFGLTSIGFLENTFFQNEKALPRYYELLDQNQLPIERGKELSMDDQIRQWTINELMCHFQINKQTFKLKFSQSFDEYFALEQSHVQDCIDDYLLTVENDLIIVTNLGKIFIRNIAMGFDWYLRQKNSHQRFSRTI